MLTARDAVMDKVAGLDAGADDYITKPFAIEELLARIRVALKKRQSAGPASAPQVKEHSNVIKIGRVTLNEESHEVMVDDERIDLTNREFELLHVLMVNKNIVMNRDKLMNLVCGYDYMGETNVIDVYIRYVRTKLDDRFGIKFITTVRGVGYVIRDWWNSEPVADGDRRVKYEDKNMSKYSIDVLLEESQLFDLNSYLSFIV